MSVDTEADCQMAPTSSRKHREQQAQDPVLRQGVHEGANLGLLQRLEAENFQGPSRREET
jgi:hypothetical protein